MNTMKGAALFTAPFAPDDAAFHEWSAITRRAADLLLSAIDDCMDGMRFIDVRVGSSASTSAGVAQ